MLGKIDRKQIKIKSIEGLIRNNPVNGEVSGKHTIRF